MHSFYLRVLQVSKKWWLKLLSAGNLFNILLQLTIDNYGWPTRVANQSADRGWKWLAQAHNGNGCSLNETPYKADWSLRSCGQRDSMKWESWEGNCWVPWDKRCCQIFAYLFVFVAVFHRTSWANITSLKCLKWFYMSLVRVNVCKPVGYFVLNM